MPVGPELQRLVWRSPRNQKCLKCQLNGPAVKEIYGVRKPISCGFFGSIGRNRIVTCESPKPRRSCLSCPHGYLTPAARAALQWRRSRNEKVVAVPALVRFHLTFSCILPTASRLQRTALTTSTLHQCRWNIESVSHLEQIEACESRARKQ